MKSISELTDFYYDTLHGDLEALEKERRELARRLIGVFAFLGITAAVISAVIWKQNGGAHDALFYVIFAAAGLGGIAMKLMSRGYIEGFKRKVIEPLIHAIEPGLRYEPEGLIPRTLFERSRLFRHSIDRYRGNDLVSGAIDGVTLRFSDVHAEYVTRDSKGRSSWHTIFQGLFIVAEFNKHFKGETVVLPDRAESLFGSWLGSWLQSKNLSREELVKLDDPGFEKAFVVYGTDQIEARYILTHAMMQRLLDFKKRSGEELFVSFRGEEIHLAVSGGDRFEPAIFHSLLDYRQAMAYIATLKLAIGIVEDLKLNEKLWSKT